MRARVCSSDPRFALRATGSGGGPVRASVGFEWRLSNDQSTARGSTTSRNRACAGFASALGDEIVHREFAANFHVRQASAYREQRDRLLLIRGGAGSRLFRRAHRLGVTQRQDHGRWWQTISPEMAEVFGRFGGSGMGSIQRSSPRRVEDAKAASAAAYVRQLD
jgi:hypothetical protein